MTNPLTPGLLPGSYGGAPLAAKPKTVKVKAGKAHTRTVKPRAPKQSAPAPVPQAPGLDPATQNLLGAATRLRFAPQEQAINQQLATSARFASGAPAWYGQAMNHISGIQAQGQQQSAGTLQNIQNYNSPAAVAGDPLAQQAATSRNNLNTQFAAAFGRDAASQSALMDAVKAGMQIAQNNALAGENVRQQQLQGELANVANQKGDFKTNFLNNLYAEQAKQDTANERNKIAADALGIKTDTLNNVQIPLAKSLVNDRTAGQRVARSKLRHTAAVDRHNTMLADSKFQLDQQKFGRIKAKDNYQKANKIGPYAPTAAGTSGPASFTPTQVHKTNANFRAAVQEIKAGGYKPGQGAQADQDLQYVGKYKDPLFRKAAILVGVYGHVDKATRHAIFVNYGIKLPLKKKP